LVNDGHAPSLGEGIAHPSVLVLGVAWGGSLSIHHLAAVGSALDQLESLSLDWRRVGRGAHPPPGMVGPTATGTGDRFATPFDRVMPGVEICATPLATS